MIITCKCPGGLRRKLFAIVSAEGKTENEAASALKIKAAVKESEFTDRLDRWMASIRCAHKSCEKSSISWVSTPAPPPPPVDFGDKWKALTSVAGVAIVFCKTAVEVKKLVPKKSTPKKD